MEPQTTPVSTSTIPEAPVTQEEQAPKRANKKLLVLGMALLLLLAVGIGAATMYLLTQKSTDDSASNATSSESTASATTSSETNASITNSSATSSARSSTASSQTSTVASTTVNKVSTQFGISMDVPTIFAYTEDLGAIIIRGEDQGSPWDRGAYKIEIVKKATATVISEMSLVYSSPVAAGSVKVGNKTYPSQIMDGGDGTAEGQTYTSAQIVNVDNKFTVVIHKKIESVGDGEVLNQPTSRDINGGLQLLASIKFN